jgi:hypothetical protein
VRADQDRRLYLRRNKDRAARYAVKNPELTQRLLLALADPGAFVKRGDNYRERLHNWQHRAVLAVLSQ